MREAVDWILRLEGWAPTTDAEASTLTPGASAHDEYYRVVRERFARLITELEALIAAAC